MFMRDGNMLACKRNVTGGPFCFWLLFRPNIAVNYDMRRR